MSKNMRRWKWAGAACLTAAVSLTLHARQGDNPRKDAKDDEPRRPKLALDAQPMISIAPARVVLTAKLTGGPNDFEEFYCPTVLWEWGDGTESESTFDCVPYEAGKAEIRRRYTMSHTFRAGIHKVVFKLKRRDKTLGTATINLQIQPGLREID